MDGRGGDERDRERSAREPAEANSQEPRIVIDLTDDENQCWMNVCAAEREKGERLTEAEKQRLYAGKHWHRPSARRRR
jgi:hypothetical protein